MKPSFIRIVEPEADRPNGAAEPPDMHDEEWNPTDADDPRTPPVSKANGGEAKQPAPAEPIDLVKLGSLISPALDRAERRRLGEERPVPVPFAGYAEALGGGFWSGAHFIVSGTGVGKSQLAIQIALAAAIERIPAHYIGLELDQMQIALRVAGARSGVGWSRLYLGRCSASDITRAREEVSALDALPFYVDFGPPRGWPASRLYTLCESARRKHPTGPLLIVLDYLQLVGDDAQPFQRRPDLREKIGGAAYAARDVGRRFDASVVVISSAARNHYGLLAGDAAEAGLITRRVPGHVEPIRTIAHPHILLGLGKESGEVEFSADTVTTLIKWPTPLDNGERAIIVAVPKVRAGIERWSALAFGGGHFAELPVKNVDELPAPPKKAGGRGAVDGDNLRRRVIATIRKRPELSSPNALALATKGNKQAVLKVIHELITEGEISVTKDGCLVLESMNA